MASDINEESPENASRPLLTPVTTRRVSRGITFNRFVSLATLIILAVVSIFFNLSMRSMGNMLQAEQGAMEKLNEIIQKQSEQIARFNESVTNQDVLDKVDALELSLTNAETDMFTRLANSEEKVEHMLNDTIEELDNSIVAAKAEIHTEVDQVKDSINDYARTTQDQFSMENDFMVYQLAGTFCVLTCLISMWHMTDHLRHLHEPYVQRKILAILWMCPIYSVTSWLSLVFISIEGYLAIIKDLYEAYCIYTFLSFIIAVLGRGDREAVISLLELHSDHLPEPVQLCGWCSPKQFESSRAKADAVLLQCQVFAMQFVFFRPLTSMLTFIFDKVGLGNNVPIWASPQNWTSMVENISITFAFWGLLRIYHLVQNDLAWYRPLPKFLCIKGVVFMTFWQGLAITLLAKFTDVGYFGNDADESNVDEWAAQTQNFLICLEMLLFTIAHFYVFPTEEWEPGYRPIEDTDTKFGDNIALRDFFSDLKLVLGSDSKKKKKKSKNKDSESGDRSLDSDDDTASEDIEGGGTDSAYLNERNDETMNEDYSEIMKTLQHRDNGNSSYDDDGDDDDDDDDLEDISNQEAKKIGNDKAKDDMKKSLKQLQWKLSGLSKDTPEVRDATQRMLSNPIFLDMTRESENEKDMKPAAKDLKPATNNSQNNETPNPYEVVGEQFDSREAANETTSLLLDINAKEEILRPSIFTTLASMKSDEDDNNKQE